MEIDRVILGPVVTEKTNLMREKHKYTFKVDSRANKLQVMQAVHLLFGVHPTGCNIITVKRKPKRVRFKPGYTASWKKAIVSLPEKETISVFEGV